MKSARVKALALLLTATLIATAPISTHAVAVAAAAAAAAPHVPADDNARAARMVAELGLIEAPAPIREAPQWRKPRRVIVREATPDRLAWLRQVAPGVELVTASSPAQAAALAKDADAVIGYCSAEILDAGGDIRWIQWYFAGIEGCLASLGDRSGRILITNMQKVAGPVMAEHVMAMTLAFARGLHTYVKAQNQGEWRPDLVPPEQAFSLSGKTLFVAGLGGIGTEVARRANALGMRVIGTRASDRPAPPFVSRVGPPGETIAMAREADVIVNALPLTEETRGLFNAQVFARMKPAAYFINVGRGATVVTADLVEALQNKRIAGAGLDVTEPEPLPAGHPLWKMTNVIITPHVSSVADVDLESRWLLMRENLRRYVAGEKMLSVVDPTRGY